MWDICLLPLYIVDKAKGEKQYLKLGFGKTQERKPTLRNLSRKRKIMNVNRKDFGGGEKVPVNFTSRYGILVIYVLTFHFNNPNILL